ncbi:MAG: hypothetical protein HXX14_04115 [Bacteroidetes bacterium]|nr:hypothetical protein [Bacteroidota bacterium]
MKSNSIFPFLLGAFLIVLGAAFFAEEIWHFHIPVFKLALGLALMFLGLRLISNKQEYSRCGHRFHHRHTEFFSNTNFDPANIQPEYSVVFGSSMVDFSKLPGDENRNVEIKCVFGDFKARINPNSNVQIISKAAFGSIEFPDFSSYAFGDHLWRSSNFDPKQPILTIRAEVAFGSIKIYGMV